MLKLLLPLMLVLFIATLDQTIVATTLPAIGQSFHNLEDVAWIATAYLLTSAITTLLFGKLGDMYGRKRIFQASIAIFLVGSLLCGFATSLPQLIVCRALQGIGGGGLNSLVQAIVGDLIPPRQRARYQTWLGLVPTLAVILGPVLGGLITDHASWRWIFHINLPIGLLALWTVGRNLQLPVKHSPHRLDISGAILASFISTGMLLALVDVGFTGLLLLFTILALGAYIFVEQRAAEPITPLHLFRNRDFTTAALLFMASTVLLFAGMLYVPLYLQMVQKASASAAGGYLIPLLVGLVAATAVSGERIAKTGRYKIYPIAGSILAGLGMLGLGWIQNKSSSAWLIVLLIMLGIGVGFLIQVALLAGQNAVDARDLGVATGALNFFKTIGGALGATICGAILTQAMNGHETTAAFQLVFRACIPVAIGGVILGLILQEKPLSDQMRSIAQGEAEAPEY